MLELGEQNKKLLDEALKGQEAELLGKAENESTALRAKVWELENAFNLAKKDFITGYKVLSQDKEAQEKRLVELGR
jgi:hypothetical protein